MSGRSPWAAAPALLALKMNGCRRMLGSLAHGSMANAMPRAIGAQLLDRARQVISLSGDSGLTMLTGDFISLVQLKLPVKAVIFNNGALSFVELEMKATGFLETGVELQNPDFAAMARAMGVHVARVKDPARLASALRDVLAHPGPALVDVVVSRAELAMPLKVTLKEVGGFSLWAAKAVMSGRCTELIDLARTDTLSGFLR